MDENQHDAYTARRAAFEAQFQALPPAGSSPYWQQLEEPDAAKRLPLEVLARCYRERNAAGAVAATDRIFTIIAGRIRVRLDQWAAFIARQARAGQQQLQEDLAQECHMKLWEELAGDGPTFLLENFGHKLDRICKHVAHAMMEREGLWIRRGVENPTRVPQSAVDSLDAQPAGEGKLPPALLAVDAHAQDEFDRADLSDLYELIRQLPDDQKQILFDRFYRDRPQHETAADLRVTDRTIRNRLAAILRDLRAQYQGGKGDKGGEEVNHE